MHDLSSYIVMTIHWESRMILYETSLIWQLNLVAQ